MKENNSDLNKETDSAVYFFTPPFYALDNFSSYTVEIWSKKFPTSEHAYQWKKFAASHPDLAAQIFAAANPNAVKKIADGHRTEVSQEFSSKKVEIMEEILRAKLAQHEKVQNILLKTGNKEIVENSPDDGFWGAGPDGKGQNMLGKLWMKLRAELTQ
jgi:N-glycosidase YbiA